MSDFIGLAAAFIAIPLIIAFAQLLLHAGIVSAPVARKLIHVGVSHWWLLAVALHTTTVYAAIGPITFIVVNGIVYRFHMLAAMEDPDHRRNLGTIYFPISLLVLVLLCFGGPVPLYAGGIGVLVMGYGDGLASIVGTRWGKGRFELFGSTKSLSGSASMFLASIVVTTAWVITAHPRGLEPAFVVTAALVTAFVATGLELATPWGLDNLSVPIGTTLFFFVAFV